MCPRCEGMGTRDRPRPGPALRRQQVARTRARSPSPATACDGWNARHLRRVGLLRPGQADPQVHEEGAARLPLPRADQDQGRRHQPDLRGADPADPEVDALQGRGGDAAAHPRLRRPGRHLHRLPRVRRHAAQRGRPLLEDRRHQHRRRLRHADQRPGRVGPRPRRAVGRAAARQRCSRRSTRSSRSASATSRSTGRRARCRAARRSARR